MFQKDKSTANVVDGKLILSLPDALSPVVWQMDLNEVSEAALEIRDEKIAGRAVYVLALKTKDPEDKNIAAFEKQADAHRALMATAGALKSAQGQIRNGGAATAGNSAPIRHNGSGMKWLFILLFIAFLFGLIMLMQNLSLQTPGSVQAFRIIAVASTRAISKWCSDVCG